MKKRFKIIASSVLALSMALAMAGCGSSAASSGSASVSGSASGSASAEANEGAFKIGIIQLVEHDALDKAREGFIDDLKENGFVDGENIVIDYQNAQADQSNLKTISQRFVQNDDDLILAIATGAAQSVAAETSDIPACRKQRRSWRKCIRYNRSYSG